MINYETSLGAVSPASDAAAWTDAGQLVEVQRGGQPALSLGAPGGVGALAFSPDGALLALGDRAGQVQLVRLADGAQVRAVALERPVRGLVWSPDGARLGVRTDDGAITVWEIAGQGPLRRIDDGAPVGGLPLAGGAADSFLFTADGGLLIAWGRGSLRFYRLDDGRLVHTLPVEVDEVAIGPRRRMLALARDGLVELWGLE